VEAYSQEFLLESADCESIEIIGALLATRWEDALRARGYSEQSAMEAAVGIELELMEAEVMMIVRPVVEGRADDIKRLIDKKLALKDITEKITKDVRRSLMLEVIEEELLAMPLAHWQLLYPQTHEAVTASDGNAKEEGGGGGAETRVAVAAAEVVCIKEELVRNPKRTGLLCELMDGIGCLCASTRRTLRYSAYVQQLETARAHQRYTEEYAHELVDEVLFEDLSDIAGTLYRTMLREKAEEACALMLEAILDHVVAKVKERGTHCANTILTAILDESYRCWRRQMTLRLEAEAVAEELEGEERAERRLRQEEEQQISAAVFSLEPVDTEEGMYMSHDLEKETDRTVTPRYSLERTRVGGVEWAQQPVGKQWLHYYTETAVKYDDSDTLRRVRTSVDHTNLENAPIERQKGVRMMALQVRQGHAQRTEEFIGLLSDPDEDVRRLCLDALCVAVCAGHEVAVAAGVLLTDKPEAHLRMCGIQMLEQVALKTGDFNMMQSLVWLVDDRTPEVHTRAVELLARCIHEGVSSHTAIAPPPTPVAESVAGRNENDYVTPKNVVANFEEGGGGGGGGGKKGGGGGGGGDEKRGWCVLWGA